MPRLSFIPQWFHFIRFWTPFVKLTVRHCSIFRDCYYIISKIQSIWAPRSESESSKIIMKFSQSFDCIWNTRALLKSTWWYAKQMKNSKNSFDDNFLYDWWTFYAIHTLSAIHHVYKDCSYLLLSSFKRIGTFKLEVIKQYSDLWDL